MTEPELYAPGPANLAGVEKDGEKWTLILVRELRHAPEKVWQALTDPAHLREWAPFEADGSSAEKAIQNIETNVPPGSTHGDKAAADIGP